MEKSFANQRIFLEDPCTGVAMLPHGGPFGIVQRPRLEEHPIGNRHLADVVKGAARKTLSWKA